MSTLDLVLSDLVIKSDLAISEKQMYKNTKRYNYNDLKQFGFLQRPDGEGYAYIDASGSSDGKNISTAIKDYDSYFTAKIPVIPAAVIEYKVFKTTSGYGSVFIDSDMTIIKSLSNTELNSGTSVTIKVPENAAFFVFSESPSLHNTLEDSFARVTMWEI